MWLCVGLTIHTMNRINFSGTSRPEDETSIFTFNLARDRNRVLRNFRTSVFPVQLSGPCRCRIEPNGFDRDTWVAGGKQGLFETDNFTSPAYVGRLNYEGVPGLRIGGSVYYCADAARNADKKRPIRVSEMLRCGSLQETPNIVTAILLPGEMSSMEIWKILPESVRPTGGFPINPRTAV